MENKTRLFFVVSSENKERELFETAEEAINLQNKLANSGEIYAHCFICIVKNAYKEDNGGWNYEDLIDTFTEVQQYI